MTRNSNRRWELALLTLILALALGTRWGHAHKGLPYLHHVDEPHTSAAALDIMKSGDLHPQRFQYGSVNVYMMLATDCLHYLYLRGHPEAPMGTAASLDSIEPATIPGYRWETSHPSFFLWNRGLCALLGTLAVLLVYLIGRRESAVMGLVAAATLAAAPEHILNSAMVAPDIPVASFSLLAVALSAAYMRSAKTSTLVLAFVIAGVTVATKYNAAPVVVAPFLALACGPRGAQARPVWLWWAGLLITGAAFLACMPYILVDLPLFPDPRWAAGCALQCERARAQHDRRGAAAHGLGRRGTRLFVYMAGLGAGLRGNRLEHSRGPPASCAVCLSVDLLRTANANGGGLPPQLAAALPLPCAGPRVHHRPRVEVDDNSLAALAQDIRRRCRLAAGRSELARGAPRQ